MSTPESIVPAAKADFATLAKAQLDGAATLLEAALTSDEAELETLLGQATVPAFVEGTLETAVHAVPGGPYIEGLLSTAVTFAGGPIAAFAGEFAGTVDAKAKGFLAQGLAIVKSRQAAADTFLSKL